jgi:long-chain acyl-CoA synthetase
MVEFRDELPKTLVGKILRRMLRAEEEAKQRDPLAEHEHEPCFDHDLHEDPLHPPLPGSIDSPPAAPVTEQAPAAPVSEQKENGEDTRKEKSA